MSNPVPPLLQKHPEYQPLFHWHGWGPKEQYSRRLLKSEAAWALKLKGPVTDTQNACEVLRRRMIRMGSLIAKTPSKIAFSAMMREMAGEAPDTEHHAGPFITRKCNGKRTQFLSVLPDVELPPNPYDLLPVTSPAPVEEPVEEPERVVPGKLPDDPIARVKAISAAERAEEVPSLRVAPPAEEEPAMTPGPRIPVVAAEPVQIAVATSAAPSIGALDEDATLAEKALLMMQLAAEVYTDALVRSAVAAEEAPAVDKDEQAVRLGAAMDQIAVLNRRLRERNVEVEKAQTSVKAVEAVLQGERRRREMAEANLAAVAKGERVPNESGFRALRTVMQEKPRVPVTA